MMIEFSYHMYKNHQMLFQIVKLAPSKWRDWTTQLWSWAHSYLMTSNTRAAAIPDTAKRRSYIYSVLVLNRVEIGAGQKFYWSA